MFEMESVTDTETGEYEIKNPKTGDQTGAVFVLAGPEHPARIRMNSEKAREVRSRFEKSGKFMLGDEDEQRDNETAMLITSVLSWSGFTYGGVELPCDETSKLALFNDPKRAWLRKQVVEALGDRTLFIAGSAQS